MIGLYGVCLSVLRGGWESDYNPPSATQGTRNNKVRFRVDKGQRAKINPSHTACSLNLKPRVLLSASVNIAAVAPCSELGPHFADSRIIFFDHLPGFRNSSASVIIICLHNFWHPLKGAPVEKPVFPHYDELDKRGMGSSQSNQDISAPLCH